MTKKVTAHSSARHHAQVVTQRQAERMKTGQLESRPSDYEQFGGEEGRRRMIVRRALEDMQLQRAIDRGSYE
jgi:hypothetical protein